jgi:hypothetical protein
VAAIAVAVGGYVGYEKVAGKAKLAQVQPENNNTNKLQIASQKEREGFQNLIAGKYDDAIKSFQDSEGTYPGYHSVYELAKLIRSRRQDMNDESKRKEVFQLILDKYSYGVPSDLLNELKLMAKQ